MVQQLEARRVRESDSQLPIGSPALLHDVEGSARWARNPIYGTLHESCYPDGHPTRWSAHGMTPD